MPGGERHPGAVALPAVPSIWISSFVSHVLTLALLALAFSRDLALATFAIASAPAGLVAVRMLALAFPSLVGSAGLHGLGWCGSGFL